MDPIWIVATIGTIGILTNICVAYLRKQAADELGTEGHKTDAPRPGPAVPPRPKPKPKQHEKEFDDRTEYYFGDKLHRENKPAVEWKDGSVEYWHNGKRWRINGPAVVRADGTIEFWVDGKQVDAETYWKDHTQVKQDYPDCMVHRRGDKAHRNDGPAKIHRNGTLIWCQNDLTHREDGPAVIAPDGTVGYYLYDKRYTEDEYLVKLEQIKKARKKLKKTFADQTPKVDKYTFYLEHFDEYDNRMASFDLGPSMTVLTARPANFDGADWDILTIKWTDAKKGQGVADGTYYASRKTLESLTANDLQSMVELFKEANPKIDAVLFIGEMYANHGADLPSGFSIPEQVASSPTGSEAPVPAASSYEFFFLHKDAEHNHLDDVLEARTSTLMVANPPDHGAPMQILNIEWDSVNDETGHLIDVPAEPIFFESLTAEDVERIKHVFQEAAIDDVFLYDAFRVSL